ncbi:MAG: substrate-binding domain-containing protein [Oscillospiraceae bacterium]|nr:substrate-binding domain-containing protein [Oscillospiraceae bacterium]
MKKIHFTLLALLFCFVMLVACKNDLDTSPSPSSIETEQSTQSPSPIETEQDTQPPDVSPVEEPTSTIENPRYQFTQDNYPRIDGSTATIPLIEAVGSALLGIPRWEIDANVSKTSGAYVELAFNRADILLVYDGGEQTRERVNADELFETVPIGKDALVFIVNKDNPINNLTTEQVRLIFSGFYTNWSEVGGSNEPIRAYQRGIGSGSQALMDKLVMPGLNMGDPIKIPTIEDMGGLIAAVADFSGSPSAIGYNVYFYVTEMRGNDYIKILSIDDVMPSYDTILSGEYPFVSEFYSVIRKSEPDDSPARALHEWLQTAEAQNLIASENYVALRANPNESTPTVIGDFSLYPPGEEPEYFPGIDPYIFTARSDYGQLYFYLGLHRIDEYSSPEFYGLCNEEGKIITEPIYTVPLLLTDSMGNQSYLCYRSDKEPTVQVETWDTWTYAYSYYPVLLFATDGSWIKEFDGASPCTGFRGAIDAYINNDSLAVMLNGKWGMVNMMGETVAPFELDSKDGIYNPEGLSGNNDIINYSLAVTGDRYIAYMILTDDYGLEHVSGTDLLDRSGNIIAKNIKGRPYGMPGVYFVTSEWFVDEDKGNSVYTYTLDGDLIASLESTDDMFITHAVPLGDYVWIFTDNRNILCDRELNILIEYPEFDYYGYGANVLYLYDWDSPYYRTYLPDGTRLVTWYDSD